MLSKALLDLQRGYKLSHVWTYQAYHDITAKYKRTALGSLWVAGQVIFTSLSFAIVFGALFGNSIQETLPYLMSGIVCYQAAGSVLTEAPEIYMSNSGIIKNHAYPFTYYSFEAVARNLILWAHNVLVLEIILVLLQRWSLPHWTLIIGLPIVAINMFTWGSLVSMVSSRYRDLRFLLPYLGGLIQFMTPIMWHPEQLKGMSGLLVTYNPFFPLVEMLRAPLLGTAMPIEYWKSALIVTVSGAILWLLFFSAHRKRIAFWV